MRYYVNRKWTHFMKKKIAIVLCTYNRMEKTKRCINTLLMSIEKYADVEYTFYVCDDNSLDGTRDFLLSIPNLILINSPGKLYWSKSMHRAMKRAYEDNPDFFLMINDDVDFLIDSFSTMLSSYEKIHCCCGIVGTTLGQENDEITYGGRDKDNKIVVPSKEMNKCMWANWNCFLIGREVVESIGLIDGKYEHSYGDFDYSYRMHKKNIPIYVAVKPVGRCDNNSIRGTYQDVALDRRNRMKNLFSPKGLPIYSFFRFNIKVHGWTSVFKYMYIYFSLVIGRY